MDCNLKTLYIIKLMFASFSFVFKNFFVLFCFLTKSPENDCMVCLHFS